MSDQYDNRRTIIIKQNTDKDGTPRTAKWADYKGTVTDENDVKWYCDLWIHTGKYGEFLSGTWSKQAEDKPQGQRGGGFKRVPQAPAYTPPRGFAAPQFAQPPAPQPQQPQNTWDLEMVQAVCPDGNVRAMPRGTAAQMGLQIVPDVAPWDRDVPQ